MGNVREDMNRRGFRFCRGPATFTQPIVACESPVYWVNGPAMSSRTAGRQWTGLLHSWRCEMVAEWKLRPVGTSLPLVDRFWEKVDRRGPDDCWEWLAGKDGKGYGSIWCDGKSEIASRVAWKLANGPIPDGIDVLHTCDNPPCCNPGHLHLGTDADNTADKVARGRQARCGYPVRGERNGSAKLTEARVIEIRRAWLAGESQGEITRRLGIPRSTIQKIVTRHTWSHV